MSEDAAVRRKNLEALWLRWHTVADAVAVLGRSASFWSGVRSGQKSFGEKLARDIESKLDLPRGALDVPSITVAEARRNTHPHNTGDAKWIERLGAVEVPRMVWGDLMKTKLSGVFCIAAPDDSMAPRVKAGKMLVFSTSESPKAGDGVLIADADGNHYFRQYRTGRAGTWQAFAINEAFQELDAARDGLTVLAVLVAEDGRWT